MVDEINGLRYNPQVRSNTSDRIANQGSGSQPISFQRSEAAPSEDKPIKGAQLERTTDGAKAQEAATEYKVRKGDSLWKIAKKHLQELNPGKKPTNKEINDMMRQISDANNLEFDGKNYKTIRPGETLKLPGASPDEGMRTEGPKPVDSGKDKTQPGKDVEPRKDVQPGKTQPGKTQPGKSTKPQQGLTPEERSKARHYGSNVSDYLVGYTDDSEKGLTKEIIQSHVNNKNVMDFLAGYENNKGLGDHFFTQLSTEYGFEEKQNLMKNVALKLSAYLKANGQAALAREVDVALQDNGLSRSEVKKLDEIVQTMLTDVPGLRS